MSRLDGLADSQFQARVDALALNVNELKTSQLAGSSNLITERVATGAAFDFTATIARNVTTGYELTIPARDNTFGGNPFIWQVFWNGVGTPAVVPQTQSFAYLPTGGQQKFRLYLWSANGSGLPETVNIQVVVYGLNIGTFTIAKIL